MSRKKGAPKKHPRTSENIAGEKSQAKTDGIYPDDIPGYDKLAARTLELWREQLSHFIGNPDALAEFTRAMEPASQLFTQGMDTWLMMVEQFGKTSQANAGMNGDGAAGEQERSQTATAKAAASRESSQKAEDGAKAATALSGAGTYAVAELTRRLAELERRFAEREAGAGPRKKPSGSAAGRKKAAQSYLRKVAEAGQKRGG